MSRSLISSPSIYDSCASRYDGLMRMCSYGNLRQAVLKDFLPALPHRATVLDIGCGTGVSTEILKRRYPTAEVRGLDRASSMLEIFCDRYPDVAIIRADFNDPELLGSDKLTRPESYDLIVSLGALSEYGQPDAYKTVYRLLRPGGFFLNVGIRRNPIGYLIGAIWGFRPVGSKSAAAACSTAGFHNVKVADVAWRYFPRTVIDFVVTATRSTKREQGGA